MITAILAWRFGVALDAVEATPVAGPHNLVALGTRGGRLLGERSSGVETGGEGRKHLDM
jgi:hypothetical protein